MNSLQVRYNMPVIYKIPKILRVSGCIITAGLRRKNGDFENYFGAKIAPCKHIINKC